MRFPLCMNFTIPRDADGAGQGVGAPAAGPADNDATADQNDATAEDATQDAFAAEETDEDVSVVDTPDVDVTTVGFSPATVNNIGQAFGATAAAAMTGQTPAASIGAGIGGYAGSALGTALGGPVGGVVGGLAGGLMGYAIGDIADANPQGTHGYDGGFHGTSP